MAFSQHMTGRSTKVISITSGKGGVGKSTIVANLATEFEKRGQRVLLFDGDLGMSNLDIMFQVKPDYSVADVIHGNADMRDILVNVTPSISLIPGGNGLFELQRLPHASKQSLLDHVSDLGTIYDVMIIDTAPGIADNVLYLNSAAQEITVVLTPDPASLADSYALIKVLNTRQRESKFSVICNQVRDEQDGQKVFDRLQSVAARFLPVTLNYRGSIPIDPHLRQTTRAQQLVCRTFPQAESARAISGLAEAFMKRSEFLVSDEVECKGSLQFFWKQLIGAA
jgi:flagellar biosynthesis protein FlhG